MRVDALDHFVLPVRDVLAMVAFYVRALGMTEVLIHPFSSLLSAYGMGLADITTKRLRDKVDLKMTQTNGLTSTFAQRLMLPWQRARATA